MQTQKDISYYFISNNIMTVVVPNTERTVKSLFDFEQEYFSVLLFKAVSYADNDGIYV